MSYNLSKHRYTYTEIKDMYWGEWLFKMRDIFNQTGLSEELFWKWIIRQHKEILEP